MIIRILSVVLAGAYLIFPQQIPSGYEITPAGKFKNITTYDRTSANGVFTCRFNITGAGDEMRELKDFVFYKNGIVQFTIKDVPGSDLSISNSGNIAFYDHTYHFKNQLTVNFYSPEGSKLKSLSFTGAYLFGFSPEGDIMGIGTPGKLDLIFLREDKVIEYPGSMFFDISTGGDYLVMAGKDFLSVYQKTDLLYSIPLNNFVRNIKILDDTSFCYITKDRFTVQSLLLNKVLYSAEPPEGLAYSDLLVNNGQVIAAMNKRNKGRLAGFISEYNSTGLSIPLKISEDNFYKDFNFYKPERSDTTYDPIPWPFYPFDSTRVVWNHYEQNMGYGSSDYSYLHQGLDLIVPTNEPAYSVQQGIVKLVLTIGGDVYWRVAVSPEQNPGRSDGWLYAHLVASSIPVAVGDTVDIHEYLGNIIHWSDDWGHIHFVEINDTGSVWLYDDNEWGINFNPLLALEPLQDTIAPVFENSSPQSKFEFCVNETSNYLNYDNLYGDIDIIVKVVDYIGSPEWQQPAYKSEYWITRTSNDSIVFPRKLGHILNHPYPMYSGGHYEPYAKILYKLDDTHPASSWMSYERDYYHIITNNDGDELLDSTERYLALDTRMFVDDWYTIHVEVFDPSGNSAVDSMTVKFVNGILSANDNLLPVLTELYQNYPNPFNPLTTISFSLTEPAKVTLTLFDIIGRETAVLIDEYREAGFHSYILNSDKYSLPSGLYFYKITAGNYSSVKKLMLLK